MARRGYSGYGRSSANYSTFARIDPARPFNIPFITRVQLSPIEDHRLYHPLGSARQARVVSGVAVGPFVVGREKSSSRRTRLSTGVSFAVPGKTIICIRRRRRRQVLFAFRKTGGGGGARRHRNQWSEVWCSR